MTLLLKGKHYFLKGKYFLQVAVLQILVFIEKCLFILNLRKKGGFTCPLSEGFFCRTFELVTGISSCVCTWIPSLCDC